MFFLKLTLRKSFIISSDTDVHCSTVLAINATMKYTVFEYSDHLPRKYFILKYCTQGITYLTRVRYVESISLTLVSADIL